MNIFVNDGEEFLNTLNQINSKGTNMSNMNINININKINQPQNYYVIPTKSEPNKNESELDVEGDGDCDISEDLKEGYICIYAANQEEAEERAKIGVRLLTS
jgi:hypothetical protein